MKRTHFSSPKRKVKKTQFETEKIDRILYIIRYQMECMHILHGSFYVISHFPLSNTYNRINNNNKKQTNEKKRT